MLITVNGNFATEIEDIVLNRILDLYPEEKLSKRPTFEKAFRIRSIELKALKEESAKILIPWQMFFLNADNFDDQIKHIEDQRKHKVSPKLLSKRKGAGNTTSKRIIDRLIRQQNFLIEHSNFPTNSYCGSLCRMSPQKAAKEILEYFGVERSTYWEYEKKEKALDYFIEKVESKYINVCRGVLTNKLLPMHQVVDYDVYKNTSGFVIKDERVPFIFLPNEINPDEAVSRQLYTLVYLLVIIGLGQYDYVLRRDLKAQSIMPTRIENRLHSITSELLMPYSELNQYKELQITPIVRDSLCQKFKVTPLALVTSLKIRGLINDTQYEELKPAVFQHLNTKKQVNHPHVSTSIRKFCGNHTYKAICFAIKTKSLPNTQAQYLIFGSINKNGFRKFCTEIEK